MKQLLRSMIILLVLGAVSSSCSTALRPYERQYINDPEMSMGSFSPDKFQLYVCTIREGSLAAEGNKGSGGCGCN